jgi:hypothetical protein
VVITSRVTQDRRQISRVTTRLNCEFVYEEKRYDAVIINLSLKGAFLSSKFLPPNGGAIKITLVSPSTKKNILLDGIVVRGNWIVSDHGKSGMFGIRFSRNFIELIEIIGKLA